MSLTERLRRLATVITQTDVLEDPAGHGVRLERGPNGFWWILGFMSGPLQLPKTNLAWNQQSAIEAAEVWLAPELNLLEWAEEEEDMEKTSPGCPTALKQSGTFRVSPDGYVLVKPEDEDTKPDIPRLKLVQRS